MLGLNILYKRNSSPSFPLNGPTGHSRLGAAPNRKNARAGPYRVWYSLGVRRAPFRDVVLVG
jgi:hypothetical protein